MEINRLLQRFHRHAAFVNHRATDIFFNPYAALVLCPTQNKISTLNIKDSVSVSHSPFAWCNALDNKQHSTDNNQSTTINI